MSGHERFRRSRRHRKVRRRTMKALGSGRLTSPEYSRWLSGLQRDPRIMGGATCFPGSRLLVSQVGAMRCNGASAEEILHSYPYDYLDERAIEYARLFVVRGDK